MKKYIFAVSFLVLTILLLNVPILSRFTISNGKTGEIVYIDAIDNAKEFVVSFRHSVNRTPVNEFIKVQENKFIVYKTTFYSYGAGMPENDAQSKQKVTINNGLVQIENIDRELKSFTYLVGTYADHTLSYKDKSMKLSEFIEPQNPAFFSIRKVSSLELIKYVLR
ncbi:MAG: DUF1850 domain-containing protein [Clostridiaceae bacterium]|nr:DUF1850 domain-containing protein [Clostridiaceae bacterium]